MILFLLLYFKYLPMRESTSLAFPNRVLLLKPFKSGTLTIASLLITSCISSKSLIPWCQLAILPWHIYYYIPLSSSLVWPLSWWCFSLSHCLVFLPISRLIFSTYNSLILLLPLQGFSHLLICTDPLKKLPFLSQPVNILCFCKTFL